MIEIDLSPIGQGLWRLNSDAVVDYQGKTILVKKGFEYDGASIPRFFWITIGSPYDPCFMRPALFHDYLYSSQEYDRKFADDLLYALLIKNKVSKFKAYKIYLAVRMFGWRHWDRKKKK